MKIINKAICLIALDTNLVYDEIDIHKIKLE